MGEINKFLEFYKKAKPGKYWSLPKDKKDMVNQMLHNKDYYAGVKNDGEWARLIVGEDYVLIQSRNISKKTGVYGDKTASLPHIVKQAKITYEPGTVLLGELCFDDPKTTSKDVGSVLRCLPEKAIARQEEGPKLSLVVFDVLAMAGTPTYNFSAEDRRAILENMAVGGYIKLTEFSDNPKKLLAKVFDRGGEGIVLMKKDEPYKFGSKKAWHSIKIKRTMEEFEAPVIRTTYPNMVYDGRSLQTWKYWQLTFESDEIEYKEILLHDYLIKGKQISIDGRNIKQALPVTKFYFKKWPAGVVVRHNGKEVTISSGLSDDDRQYLLENGIEAIANKELVAVYSGMEETEEGSIRHPFLIRLRNEA